jgi:CheY-like chemotaxis protein
MSQDPSEEMRVELRQSLHDFNNVLGLILGFAGLLVRDLKTARAANPALESMLDKAQEILDAAIQGEAIVKRMGAVVRARPAAPAAAPTHGNPAPAAGAARRFLLAGDTAHDKDALAEAFRGQGWSIEVHGSGADALRAFRSKPEDYAAVIATQSADELGGPELIDALKALEPDVPCALLLNPDEPLARDAAQLARANVLRKLPLSVEETISLAHALVRSGPARH